MIDWHQYWNSRPASFADDDVLRQVGWTVNGQPISAVAVDAMAADIVAGLCLTTDDTLLDLCCGNGLLTARCALHCRHVTGVDFSVPLIRIARERFLAENIEYVVADVRALPSAIQERPYSKIMMYGALQHLSAADVELLLQQLRESHAHTAPLFVGAIPDRDRLWAFYNTEERRREYARRVQEGTEALGHWWTVAELSEVARRAGYRVELLPETSTLPTAHYRFDALFTPTG